MVYLIGICAGNYFLPDSKTYAFLYIAEVVSICFFFGIAIGSRYRNFELYRYLSILFYIFLFFLGWHLSWQHHPAVQQLHFSRQKSQILVGSINEEPKITRKNIRFSLNITHTILQGSVSEGSGNLLVNIKLDTSSEDTSSVFRYGDKIMIPSNHIEVTPPRNPNEFDYKAYLGNHLIWHQINLSSADVLKIDSNGGNVFIKYALRFRQKMVEKLKGSLHNKDVVAIASAIVLGYRDQLDQEVLNKFSQTGTIHVLAVSGLHVGIVFAVFSALLFWMKGAGWRFIKAVLLILLVWIYALITGFSPSVLRAAIMISFGIVAFSIARSSNIYNTIAASAFFLLLYKPQFIFEIGFELSYLAVLGIVLLYPKIHACFIIKNRFLSAIWSYAAVSIAAQIATFPLVIYYFHFFPVYFLPANVLIILPVSFVLYLGLLVLLLPYGKIHSAFSWLLEHLISTMNSFLNTFEDLPYSTVGGIWIEPWHYLLLYIVSFVLILFLLYKDKRSISIIFICLTALLIDRSVKEIRKQLSQEIRIYSIYRNMGIGFFDKRGAVIYTDSLTKEDRRFQYSIAPNLDASLNQSKVIVVNQGDSFQRANLFIRDNIIQFGNKSLFIYSKKQQFADTISVDLLYIRDSPKIELHEIQKNIHFGKIILDSSNTDRYIQKVKEKAQRMNISVYVLKNNFAYVW